jgi:ribosomal protein L37AE/L43A
MKINIDIPPKTVNQLRKKTSDVLSTKVNKFLTKKKEVKSFSHTTSHERTNTYIKYSIIPKEGYTMNKKLIKLTGMSIIDVINNLIVPAEYVFVSMRDPKCCPECTEMDYQVSKKVWTVDEIKDFMSVGGFTQTLKNGQKRTYRWKGELNKIFNTSDNFIYYKGMNENLLHPNCRCAWIPLSIYGTSSQKLIW